MFFKGHNDRSSHEENESFMPNGNLDPSQIQLSLLLHHGIPRTSSKLTFDPVQRLLAIGTLDGRIKLIGTDGVEGILVSGSRSRCKFLEFANNQGFIINVTAENDIEVWNLEKCSLVQTCRWHTNITAFAMIQGSSFMYVGEDTGNVAVLEYNKENSKLCRMQYNISFQASIASKGFIGQSSPPSVIGILPFPETNHRRVLLAYSNGLLIVWGLYDAAVLSVRGIQTDRNDLQYGYRSGSDEEREDKDICCMCWAGDLLAVGYTDGDIWIWNVTETIKRPGLCLDSTLPSMKLRLSESESRSPVIALRWYPSGKESSGIDGYLLVYGGGEFGCSEVLMICALTTSTELSGSQNIQFLELPLEALFDDVILLPKAGGTPSEPASGFLVLTSQGQLHAYDAVSIKEYFEQGSEDAFQDAILVNPFVTEPIVTTAIICSLPVDGKAAEILSQLPHGKGNMPSVLSRGTKWPITGGLFNKSLLGRSNIRTVLITGHADGSINVWDATSCAVSRICSISQSVNLKMKLPENVTAVSHLEFCPRIGMLVVARNNGLVLIYNLCSAAGEIRCRYFTDLETQEHLLPINAGFQCVVVLHFEGVVSSIAIIDHQKHVCVGYANGMVLFFDVHTCTIIYRSIVLSDANKRIKSLSFGAHIRISTSEVSVIDSPRSDSSSDSLPHGVIYILEGDTSLVALAYNKEAATICGQWQIDDASRVLYHCRIDIEKMTVSSLDNNESSVQIADKGISSCFILVCTENIVCLYASITSKQNVELKKLKSESFSTRCRHATVFANDNGDAYGLVVLYLTGTLEIRSLPDFGVVKQLSLAEVYNLDPKFSEPPMFVCGDRGLIAFVDVKRELILISILASDELTRTEDSNVLFYDKDLSAAADAALKAIAHPAHRKVHVQHFIGGVLKDIKGGVIKGGFLKSPKGWKESSGIKASMDLRELFSSISTAEQISNPELQKLCDSQTVALDMELNIDDIEIDDEDSSCRESAGSSEQHSTELKGKGRFSDASDDRAKLFSGEGHAIPVRLSLDEIKAKYGRRTAGGDVAGAAGLARDKLLERQEKLEALNKRTEELEQGAENFASLAAELAKAMEKKKWWQI